MKMNCMPKQEWRIECTQVKDLRMNWICEGIDWILHETECEE